MKRYPTLLLAAGLLSLAAACSVSTDESDTSDDALTETPTETAALANLKRVAREIDINHLRNYLGKGVTLPPSSSPEFPDVVAKAFLAAVKLEYAAEPELLKRRLQTLASMVFFSAPEVTTDASVGRLTPFHGMNDRDFEALMRNEDTVFQNHMSANNGSPNGVRPFSVCETKFLIGISKGENTDEWYVSYRSIWNYNAYAKAYASYAKSCAPQDLAEWYNFRGLGALRPSWLESNYNDRILRRMLSACNAPKDAMKAACTKFNADRLAYRDEKNVALALREMVYDTSPQSNIQGIADERYMSDPSQPGIFVEDQNGDGVAEWVTPGPVALVPKAKIKLQAPGSPKTTDVVVSDDGKAIVSKGKRIGITSAILEFKPGTGAFAKFSADTYLSLTLDDGTTSRSSVRVGDIQPLTRVDPRWKPEMAKLPDLGLGGLFADPTGCTGDIADPLRCPLEKRFYSMIDRHENFYQTYSSGDPTTSNISSQPSPLVACSITLSASHAWDSAGKPDGGTAGFIYLMRIPFDQILTGDTRSIDTLGRLRGDLKSGPQTLKIQDVVAGKPLDMHKVWLDIATLSNNKYSSEHEVSKFGTVPAEQIEGVLVIRRPAALP